MSADETKILLEDILAKLYLDQAGHVAQAKESYLTAGDGQFLGRINNNRFDTESILNHYGPYGSKYSPTSIFNPYSAYGSKYGSFSINNPYCSTPPELFINGRTIGRVTSNQHIRDRIAPDAFIWSLQNDLVSLLDGQITKNEAEFRKKRLESFIEGADGAFLGSLQPDRYNTESLFNAYGPYGNRFSESSIFNRYSTYGSAFSTLSPYNRFTSTPPKLFVNGKFVAYLTVNSALRPSVSPDDVLIWAEQNIPRIRLGAREKQYSNESTTTYYRLKRGKKSSNSYS